MLRYSSLTILTYVRVRSGRSLRGASLDARILGSSASGAALAITSDSNAINVLLAEKSLGAEQQEYQRQHVREPTFDAAADMRPEIDLGQLFRRTDDKTADDRSRNRLEAAEDQYRQRLQREKGQRELHPVACAPQHARDQSDEAGDRPDDPPDLLQRYPHGQRGLVIVGDRP